MVEVFKTLPVLKQKVWGGRKLETLFAKELDDPCAGYGEAWEVADLPEGQSVCATGIAAGTPLGDLVDIHGARLVGTAAPGGRFPLLVKLLDAADDLSVQVHPGPEHLGLRPWAQSKDECWLILDADPGGSILHGFREPTTREAFRAAVSENRAVDMLRRVEVRPGDVFRVPPGTIHAICAGVALLEIQQPSDTTYRVYDYGRPGLDGLPRQLHLDDALDVATFAPPPPDARQSLETQPDWEVLAAVDAYRIEKLRPTGDCSWAVSPHTAQVVHVLRGSCALDDVIVGPSETAIIPASLGRVWLTRAHECELVVAGLGGGRVIDRAPVSAAR